MARKPRSRSGTLKTFASAVAAIIVALLLRAFNGAGSPPPATAPDKRVGEQRPRTAEASSPVATGTGQRPLRYFTLALSLAPAFCERNGNRNQCQRLSAEEFARSPLTLHGLWEGPESADSCEETAALPPVGRLDPRLARWMPGIADNLQRHEWDRHGRRSCMPPERYFSVALDWTERVHAALGATIAVAAGQSMATAELRRVAERAEPGLGRALQLVCRQLPHRGNAARERRFLVEMRTCLGIDAQRRISGWTDCRDVDQIDQGCPDRVWIDRAGDD